MNISPSFHQYNVLCDSVCGWHSVCRGDTIPSFLHRRNCILATCMSMWGRTQACNLHNCVFIARKYMYIYIYACTPDTGLLHLHVHVYYSLILCTVFSLLLCRHSQLQVPTVHIHVCVQGVVFYMHTGLPPKDDVHPLLMTHVVEQCTNLIITTSIPIIIII